MPAPRAIACTAAALACVVLLSIGTPSARSQAGTQDSILASLQVEGQPTPATWSFTRAEYDVEVYGASAIGTLTHRFHNDGDEPLTAVYEATWDAQFVLKNLELGSEGSFELLAVESYDAVQEPKQARRTPQQKQDPPTAFELRSVPFTIAAGEEVDVRVHFGRSLSVSGRRFLLELPGMTRTRSTTAKPAAVQPELPLKIIVTVQHDRPLELARSVSHDILTDFERDRTVIEPVESEVPASRTFKLEFATNQRNAPTLAGILRGSQGDRQAVEAILNPPEDPQDVPERPKQVLFVVDTSGSMKNEEKLDQARGAVLTCIEKLGEQDRFNIVEFDTRFSFLIPQPTEPTEFQKNHTTRWLAGLKAQGGTSLLPALEAVMSQDGDPERHRMIILVSDGMLDDEKQVLELIDRKLGDGRFFVVGTGSSIRQKTILALAERGRGAAAFAGDARSLAAAVEELFASVASPLGWDLEFDWGGAEIAEISPSRLPDLYAGRSVKVLAWVRGDLPDELNLKMSTMDGEQRLLVRFPPQSN